MTTEEVLELALCEQNAVILRANVLYRFVVIDGCETCADLAEAYDD